MAKNVSLFAVLLGETAKPFEPMCLGVLFAGELEDNFGFSVKLNRDSKTLSNPKNIGVRKTKPATISFPCTGNTSANISSLWI